MIFNYNDFITIIKWKVYPWYPWWIFDSLVARLMPWYLNGGTFDRLVFDLRSATISLENFVSRQITSVDDLMAIVSASWNSKNQIPTRKKQKNTKIIISLSLFMRLQTRGGIKIYHKKSMNEWEVEEWRVLVENINRCR